MDTKPSFQLVVYEGDFSLPSIDPESIKSILYCGVAGIPLEIKLFNSYKVCMFNRFPPFLTASFRSRGFDRIVKYLNSQYIDIDRGLDPMQCSESLALTHLVTSKLKPVIEFNYWVEHRNCYEFINVWFMRCLPIPFNYLHTWYFKNRAHNLIESLYPNETDIEVIKEYLQRAAVDCLSSLSTRLGNNDYFYGNKPTSLDVVVYAYLAPFLKIPLPLNETQNVINMWPNLVNLVKRIDTKYFPDAQKGSKYIKLEEKSKTSDDEVSYVAIVILTLSATSLMLGFAYSRGYLRGKLLQL